MLKLCYLWLYIPWILNVSMIQLKYSWKISSFHSESGACFEPPRHRSFSYAGCCSWRHWKEMMGDSYSLKLSPWRCQSICLTRQRKVSKLRYRIWLHLCCITAGGFIYGLLALLLDKVSTGNIRSSTKQLSSKWGIAYYRTEAMMMLVQNTLLLEMQRITFSEAPRDTPSHRLEVERQTAHGSTKLFGICGRMGTLRSITTLSISQIFWFRYAEWS